MGDCPAGNGDWGLVGAWQPVHPPRAGGGVPTNILPGDARIIAFVALGTYWVNYEATVTIPPPHGPPQTPPRTQSFGGYKAPIVKYDGVAGAEGKSILCTHFVSVSPYRMMDGNIALLWLWGAAVSPPLPHPWGGGGADGRNNSP